MKRVNDNMNNLTDTAMAQLNDVHTIAVNANNTNMDVANR
jgi:hypothetical protein